MIVLFIISITRVDRFTKWCNGDNVGTCQIDLTVNPSTNEKTLIHTASGSNSWTISSSVFECTTGDEIELSATSKTQSEGISYVIVGFDENNTAGSVLASGTIATSGSFVENKLTTIIQFNIKNFSVRFYGKENVNCVFKEIKWSVINHYNVPTSEFTVIENDKIKLTFSNILLNISVLDKRTNRTWSQRWLYHTSPVINFEAKKSKIMFQILAADVTTYTIEVSEDSFTFEIDKDHDSTVALSGAFPMSFMTEMGDTIYVPYEEGIGIDAHHVDGGMYWTQKHLSMAFTGISNGESSMIMIFETPYEGEVFLSNYGGNLYMPLLVFSLEKGRFSYARRVRYGFIPGTHVAIAKRYREYVKSIGRFKTLSEKKKTRPNIEKLIGAVNVWPMVNTDKDNFEILEEMEALWMEHLLLSNGGSKVFIDAVNENHSKVIIGIYDIFQDQMNPEYIEAGYIYNSTNFLPGAYPDDIVRDKNGDMVTSWEITNNTCVALNPDGDCPRIGSPVLCDAKAPAYAAKKVNDEYDSGYHYKARFIDTTFASGYRECYHKDHPMTFTQSAKYRVDLMKVFHDRSLVVGTEDGRDPAIPYTDYFEGMMSPPQYRVPGSGPAIEQIFYEVPNEPQTKFMVNESFRVPLFELVYHDCAVPYWYWCDHNSKVLPLWDKRDLFNRLYGTPPMFLFNRTNWEVYKDRFVQSYKTAEEVSLKTGYSEMVDHKYLTSDRTVQQTLFANGVRVTVNFGKSKYGDIESMGSLLEENVLENGLAGWEIALIVIAVLIVVAAVAIAGFLIYRKTRISDNDLKVQP